VVTAAAALVVGYGLPPQDDGRGASATAPGAPNPETSGRLVGGSQPESTPGSSAVRDDERTRDDGAVSRGGHEQDTAHDEHTSDDSRDDDREEMCRAGTLIVRRAADAGAPQADLEHDELDVASSMRFAVPGWIDLSEAVADRAYRLTLTFDRVTCTYAHAPSDAELVARRIACSDGITTDRIVSASHVALDSDPGPPVSARLDLEESHPCGKGGVPDGGAADGSADSGPDASHLDAGVDAGPCSAGCLIGGACYAAGVANPTQACLRCQPATSATSWSNAANGTTCDDGNACTKGDVCTNGACGGAAYTCTAADCQASSACDGTGGCTTTNKADGATCASDGISCTTDVCQGGACSHAVAPGSCLINGACHATGAVNSADACQSCDPAQSPSNWTTQANSCSIGSTCYAANAPAPGNVCQSCQPAVTRTAWSNGANGSSCNVPV
jgi:hypothetical protein